MAKVDIVFKKHIFQLHVISCNIRRHRVVIPLGNCTRAPTGPVMIPGAVLRLAGIGVRITVVPVMLFKSLNTVYPDMVSGIVKFSGIAGVQVTPSVTCGDKFQFGGNGIFGKLICPHFHRLEIGIVAERIDSIPHFVNRTV